MKVLITARPFLGCIPLVNTVQFVDYNIDQAPDDIRGVRVIVDRLFMDEVEVGIERPILVGLEGKVLMFGGIEEIKFIKISDVCLAFEKKFLSEEKYPRVIIASQVGEFPDCRRRD